MAYDFSDFKKKITNIEEWLKKEFSGLRTGRATITLLDSVLIDAYGSKIPLNQSANLSIEDPRTIRIVPWDKSLIGAVEKGITVADLGVSTASDGEGVRVIFPELTTENRQKLVKVSKTKVEDAKISIRGERSDAMKEIETAQKNGEIGEDDAKRDKDTLQKLVDEANKKMDELGKQKEQEILCQ